MSNNKPAPSIDILATDDGSPTLSLNGGEKMHSMAGALSESLFIYGPCIEKAMESGSPRILSMGLGLGYNELISLCFFMKNNVHDFQISSFENEDFLTQSLLSWINGKEAPLNRCYNEILSRLATEFNLNKNDLFDFCKTALEKDFWKINGPLILKNQQNTLFNGILYDAFSSETNKELWTEQHLLNFLDSYCDKEQCFFTTYAAIGNLKRSLKEKGFLIEKKAGFGKKRESTFAYRISKL